MKHQKQELDIKGLSISLLISGILLVSGIGFMDTLTVSILIHRIVVPVGRLMIFITLGLCLGQYLELTGLTTRLSVMARPLFRFGKLGDRCAAAFTTAFVSGVAANGMLLEFYREKTINRKQVYLTVFVNHLPAYFLHLPTTFFIVLPLTGRAGMIYFGITFLATVLRVFLFLLYGNRVLNTPAEYGSQASNDALRKADQNQNQHQDKKYGVEPDTGHSNRTTRLRKEKQAIWTTIRKKLPIRLTRVFAWILPTYILVFMINAAGFFQFLNTALSNFMVTRIVPVESLSVVILSFVAEFTSGFAAAGALLDSGAITVKQTVIALLTGNIIAFPIRAIRHQLPRYIGIFSPKMGTALLLLGQGFRVASIILVGVIYYLII